MLYKREDVMSIRIIKVLVILLTLWTLIMPANGYGSSRFLWRTKVGGMITTTPLIYRDFLYIQTSGYLWILDKKTKTVEQMVKTAKTPDASPLIEGDTIYLIREKDDGFYIQAYSLLTAKMLWEIGLGKYDNIFTPSTRGDLIYTVCTKDEGKSTVFAISKDTGRLIWRAFLDSYVANPLSVSEDAVYVGTDSGNLYALSRDDGKLKWNFFTERARTDSPEHKEIGTTAGICKDTVYVGSEDTNFYAIDKKTGDLKWKFATYGGQVASPAIDDDTIYVASKDGFLYALSKEDGTLKWKYETGYRVFSSPVISGDYVYIGDTSGIIHEIEKGTGKVVWRFDIDLHKDDPIPPASFIIVDKVLYAGDMGGNLFALSIPYDNATDWPMFMYNPSHTGCRVSK